MKYILEPGSVQEYTPGLPDGGWTDDDTDVAWPCLVEALADTLGQDVAFRCGGGTTLRVDSRPSGRNEG